MRLADKILRRFGYSRRSYAAAQNTNILSDWLTTQKTADQEIRLELRALRARSRDLCQNDPYAKKYLKLRRMNVVGSEGFALNMKAGEWRNGQFVLDKFANTLIKNKWLDWCKRENCAVTGNDSFWDICNLVCDHSARDGEFLIRKVRSNKFKYGFALQVIEPDLLNERLNTAAENGNVIRMGVEIDQWRRPVAYMITKVDPTIEVYYTGDYSWNFERVPASDVYHGYDKERAFQTRGVPMIASSMVLLRQLHGYIESAVVNARVTAAKMGYYVTHPDAPNQFSGDSKDSNGNFVEEVEPGVNRQLPPGITYVPSHPEYPTAQHEMFVKTTLQGVSSGWNVSYMSLTGDLSDASYSSARVGLLEERDHWRSVQTWMIETFLERVFADWLTEAFLSGQLDPLPISKFDKFNAPEFVGRRWDWVDPYKDAESEVLQIQAGLKTATKSISEKGGDIDSVYQELADEKAKAKALGLTLGVDNIKVGKVTTGITPDSPDMGAPVQKSLAEIIVERGGNGKDHDQ